MISYGNTITEKDFDFIERPNDEMGAGMVRWLNR